jgi:WD40 repeat protein
MCRRAIPFICLFALLVLENGEAQRGGSVSAQTNNDKHSQALPKGAVARLGTTRFWHEGIIGAIAFSPDGKRVATGGMFARPVYQPAGGGGVGHDNTIRLWDTTTGGQFQRIELPAFEGIAGLAFSRDGKLLAAGTTQGVIVWDMLRQREMLRIASDERVTLVAFSRDSKRLFWGVQPNRRMLREGASFHTWDLADKKETHSCKPPSHGQKHKACFAATLSPDGNLAAWVIGQVAKEGDPPVKATLHLTDMTGKSLKQVPLPDPSDKIYNNYVLGSRLLFSPDGKTLAYFGDKLELWDPASGKKRDQISSNNISTAAFSPDGLIFATYHWDDQVRIWDLATKKQRYRLVPQTSPAPFFLAHEFKPLAFSEDGKTLATAYGSTLHLFDVAGGREKRSSPGHQGPVGALHFSADGKFLISQSDTSVCRWDTKTWSERDRLHVYYAPLFQEREALAISFAADAYFTLGKAVGKKAPIELRSLGTGRLLQSLPYPKGAAYGAQFSPDGKYLVLGNGTLFQVQGLKEIDQFPFPNSMFAPNRRQLVGSSTKGSVVFVDLVTGKTLEKYPRLDQPEGNQIHAVLLALSADGSRLASVPDGKHRHAENEANFLRVWRLADDQELQRLRIPPGKTESDRASCLAISPDGRTAALGLLGETEIRLLEVVSGQERGRLKGHKDTVLSLAFSPTGHLLVSGSEDNTAIVWDLEKMAGVPLRSINPKLLAEFWDDLLSADAVRAWQAESALWYFPDQAVAFIKDRLHAVRPVPAKEVARFIKDLGHQQFAIREKAYRHLASLEEAALSDLKTALQNTGNLEVRRRLEKLLQNLDPRAPSPKRLRQLRALEILEKIQTRAARDVLENLAKGVSHARLTWEAQESLKRWKK